MQLTPDIKELRERSIIHYAEHGTVVHDWLHIRNVANGAVFFVRALGGNEREQQLGYVSGLVHDWTREKIETITHEITSAEIVPEIMKDYSSFSGDEISEIVRAVRDHRKPTKWHSPVHQSVYLADKIFEHMGAYIVFRAPAWIGETGDKYSGSNPVEKMFNYCEKIKERVFLDGKTWGEFNKLAKYQQSWFDRFADSLTKKEEWAIDIINEFADVGKNNGNLEDAIINFKPKTPEQEEYHKETIEYLEGEKIIAFLKMLKT